MSRLRLLVVMVRPHGSPAVWTGGGQISTLQIALHLRDLGVDVYTLEGNPSVLFDYARDLRGYVLRKNSEMLGDVLGAKRIAMSTKCDSIYAYTSYFEETIVPSFLAALISRKRLLVGVLDDKGRAEDVQPFLRLIMARVRSRPGFRSLVRYAAFHASRRLACRTGICLAASRQSESYAKSILRAHRTFVVGRGVEKLWFERKNDAKTYDCVYSGRFDPSKRVSTLIRAWQIVVAKKPDAKLLLIGDGGAELPLVKRLIGEFGLSSNVTFGGFIKDRHTLAEMIGSSRMFVFPSTSEGFGLVVAEAMAAGLPCVLSDIPVLREVFGSSAAFSKVDEPTAFADAILDLLQDERKQNDYSQRGRSLAKGFSWEEVAKKVLNAITVP
jgi:glycosyltransferase involved in cell wall biosynthesis